MYNVIWCILIDFKVLLVNFSKGAHAEINEISLKSITDDQLNKNAHQYYWSDQMKRAQK